jgi:hypothetical protein
MGMDGFWWTSRTSNPLSGAYNIRGGFDSHTFPYAGGGVS